MAADPRERLGAFAGYLREHGCAIGYAEVELMLRAAAALPLRQWQRIEPLWRGIASGTRKQWTAYPDLHQAFWFPEKVKGSTRSTGVSRRGRTLHDLVAQIHNQAGGAPPRTETASRASTDGSGVAVDEDAPLPRAEGGASRTEAMDQKDFADWLPSDVERFEPLVEAFRRRVRRRVLRRWQRYAKTDVIHLRRSMRAALATGGELVRLHHVRRQRRLPRMVLLVDVSRSMEAHAQFYLRLARTFVEVMNARAFVFHTRLADVTALMKRRSNRVQEKINAVTFGFGGGTKIASCVHEATHKHLGRAFGRGDMLLIFSDGYDTDEPAALAEALSHVRARGARLYWLHPTKGRPQSAAVENAKEHVTRFMPAYNLDSLSRLPELLV